MTDDNLSAADPFGPIADEFVEAIRRGQRPSVEEFARRYPEHAAAIREVLPALVLMEKAKSAEDLGQRLSAKAPTAAPLRQLLESPLRREIAKRILAGESAVWVLIESGDAAKDEAALELLKQLTQRATESGPDASSRESDPPRTGESSPAA